MDESNNHMKNGQTITNSQRKKIIEYEMVSVNGGGGGLGGSSGDSSPHVEETDVSRTKD